MPPINSSTNVARVLRTIRTIGKEMHKTERDSDCGYDFSGEIEGALVKFTRGVYARIEKLIWVGEDEVITGGSA